MDASPQADSTLDLLAHYPFPQLAAALRARSEAIIRRWELAARQMLPCADELTFTQLRNSLPDILHEIADALESVKPAPLQELIEGTKEHGECRFHQNYNIRELIIEYRLLRRMIIEQTTAELGQPLSEKQNVALNMAIDTAVQSGLIAFTDHQREQIRGATEVESRYLSFLSHDLRNHLNHATLVLTILGQKLAGQPGFEESAEDIDSIQRSIFHTMAGMDRLLQAERLRQEAIAPKIEPVDLASVLTECAKRLTQEARAKGVRLEVDAPPAATIRSDRELIMLVVQNLLGNAVKYSSSGVIRLSAEPTTTGESGFAIAVSDQGPGIAPDKIAHLFEAFTRGETHGQPGVGLGLSIASRAAKILCGKLEVESTLGAGSTFRLILSDAAAP